MRQHIFKPKMPKDIEIAESFGLFVCHDEVSNHGQVSRSVAPMLLQQWVSNKSGFCHALPRCSCVWGSFFYA